MGHPAVTTAFTQSRVALYNAVSERAGKFDSQVEATMMLVRVVASEVLAILPPTWDPILDP